MLSICSVDTWFPYSTVLDSNYESQNEFYGYLAEEFNDNTHDDSRERRRSVGDPRRRMLNNLVSSPRIKNDGSGRCWLSIYLTAIKRKRIDFSGKASSNMLQGICNICSYKITWCCSKCEDDNDLEKLIFLHNPKSKIMHFTVHVQTCIDDDN